MQIVVNLDPDVEELVRQEARNRNVEFDRALNDAIRAGLAPGASGQGPGALSRRRTQSVRRSSS